MPLVAPLLAFSALAAGAAAWAVSRGTCAPGEVALLLGGGLLAWSPLEYVMHRLFFHVAPVPPRRVHPHTGHHGHPDDRGRIPTPLWLSLPIAVLIWALARPALGSWERASLVMAGLLTGYLLYEILHYRIHTAPAPGPLLQRWRAYHFHHHFQDERRAFGVSTPLWDAFLFTLPRKDAP